MTNKNVRAMVCEITLGNTKPQVIVVLNKEQLNKLLFVTAVKHWRSHMLDQVIPNNRKAVIDQFYADDTNHRYSYKQCTIAGSDSLNAQQMSADKTVEQRNKAKKTKKTQDVVEVESK